MNIAFSRPKPIYAPMPKEQRRALVKRQGFCSTAPAERINDTIFCGNGALTALLYGDPIEERIDFHHELLYMPKWKNPPAPPKIADVLPEVRKMLREGELRKTPAYALNAILRDPVYDELMRWSPDRSTRWSIQSNRRHGSFSLNIHMDTAGEVRDYLRTADFSSGETKVYYTDDRGAYVRSLVVSRPDSAAFLKLEGPVGCLSGRISLTRLGGQPEVTWENGARVSATLTSEDSVYMFRVTGRYQPALKDMGFAAAVCVRVKGGSSRIDGDAVALEKADGAVISVCVDRSAPFDGKLADQLCERLKAVGYDYDALLEKHAKVHASLMQRSELEINEPSVESIEELLEAQVKDPSRLPGALYEKMYAAGRSYLVSDSGSLPPGYGQYNINVNLQVCSGNITSLPEMMEVFFRFFESKFADFRLNAQNIFGCRGILASIHPDEESGLMYHFSGPWPHYYWISCAGWVYNEFWGHYLTTGDETFLKDRILPGLKEIALFYEDYLTDRDEEGNYIFYPCFSPENGQARGYPITINALMDIFVCREVLENLLEAVRILGLSEEKAPVWREMLSHMPTLLLDRQGALREWAWDSIPDDLDHRHVSHHYAVWPGFEINTQENTALAEAVLKSNHKRGQENDSAHGLMHRLFTAIRLGDTRGAEVYLHQFAEHGFINSGLMTNHNPYRSYFPDALGGLPAALAEMCAVSRPGHIELLAAMSENFATGRITGLSLYTFARLDSLSWDLKNRQLCAEITSLKDQTVALRCGRGMKQIFIDGKEAEPCGAIQLSLKKDKTTTIRIRF